MAGRLSGETFTFVVDEVLRRYDEMVDIVERELLASGAPPLTVPRKPREQWAHLKAQKDAGSPEYYDDPEAQKAFARLDAQFGGI